MAQRRGRGQGPTWCSRSAASSWALSWRSPGSSRLMTSTQGKKNSPPGNSRRRDAPTATLQGGTTPRPSSSPVAASITGMLGFRITPSARTAPAPTRAPWVTMHRLPMLASSPTITGVALGGSSTPPIPTPPARCTRAPICAHDATVAQVSTMEPAPTRAPMLTYEGMSTTPRPRNEPQRADAPGTARTPASANPCLRGSLSAYSNGPSSIVSIPRSENSSRMDFLSHSWTTTWSVAGSTSATRASPLSSRSMASSTSLAASVSAGDSSPRRSQSSSICAWRSAMAHPTEALLDQLQPVHRLHHRHPHVAGATLAVEIARAHQKPTIVGQRLRHRPRIGPSLRRNGDPQVEAALGQPHRDSVGTQDPAQVGHPLPIAGALSLDVDVVIQRRHARGLRRTRDHEPRMLAHRTHEVDELGIPGVEAHAHAGQVRAL